MQGPEYSPGQRATVESIGGGGYGK
jgi:hypothetical protein